VAVLLLCDMYRRLWIAHEGVPMVVVQLWGLGVSAALLLSVAGSLLGRRLTIRKLRGSAVQIIDAQGGGFGAVEDQVVA